MTKLDIYHAYIENLPKETRKIYVTHRFGKINWQTAHIFSYNYELKEKTIKTLDYKFFELAYYAKNLKNKIKEVFIK